MIQREWQRVRLRGSHWWEGTTFAPDHQRENPRAEASRIETEDRLSKLLAEGWTIASVVAAGPILLFQTRVGALWQEAFTVFLEREICDPVPHVAH
jgi:hypothetical protein